MFGIAGRRDEGRKPVQAGEDAIFDLARRHLARPAQDGGHAEAAFQRRPLAAGKGVCPPSGQVKFSVPLSVVKTMMVLSSRPLSLRYFMTEPTMSSSCAIPASSMSSRFPACAWPHTYPTDA